MIELLKDFVIFYPAPIGPIFYPAGWRRPISYIGRFGPISYIGPFGPISYVGPTETAGGMTGQLRAWRRPIFYPPEARLMAIEEKLDRTLGRVRR